MMRGVACVLVVALTAAVEAETDVRPLESKVRVERESANIHLD